MRLGLPVGSWWDVDFPEVIRLKRQLHPETEEYRYVASSVTDLGWLDSVDETGNEVLVIAEGLLMYLSEAEIGALLDALRVRFTKYTMIFDAYSRLTAKRAQHHPSLKRTGAVIKWGGA